jgi:Ca2+-binding EF-hand superfamily protein
VCLEDVGDFMRILGISPSKRMMDDLLSARPGSHNKSLSSEDGRGINFTMFLTMMSERLFEFDTEAELVEAFESFDEDDTGVVKVEEMKKWLSEIGDRMDVHEVRIDCGSVIFCVLTVIRWTDFSKDRLRTDKGTLTIGNGSRLLE